MLSLLNRVIPWMEELGRLQSIGSLRVRHDWATSLSLSCIGEGNDNPLQCSCLENPMMEKPGTLQSMGSHRVRHDWSDLAAAGSRITADGDQSHDIQRRSLLGRKVMTNLDSILKSRDITLPIKICLVKAMFFSSSHVWMWELDYKDSWAPKNWCFWTVLLEKTLESRLDCKEIQPINPKGNQSWMFIERTDTETETPILWPPDVKNWLIGKDPDARVKIEVRRRRGQQRMRW